MELLYLQECAFACLIVCCLMNCVRSALSIAIVLILPITIHPPLPHLPLPISVHPFLVLQVETRMLQFPESYSPRNLVLRGLFIARGQGKPSSAPPASVPLV